MGIKALKIIIKYDKIMQTYRKERGNTHFRASFLSHVQEYSFFSSSHS